MPDRSPSIPVIFVHGAGVTGAWWHPQVQALGGMYAVAAPDLPGHGTRADMRFTMRSSREMLAALVTAEAPAVLVGISLGGYVAMSFASENPAAVRGLVLTGCSMNLNGLSGLGFRLTSVFLKFKGTAWLEEGTLAGFRKRISPELLEPVLRKGLHLDTATAAFSEAAGRNYYRDIERCKSPILILNGAGDEPNVRHQERLLAHAPNGSLLVIEKAGHLTNLEQPGAYTRAIQRFIESLL